MDKTIEVKKLKKALFNLKGEIMNSSQNKHLSTPEITINWAYTVEKISKMEKKLGI